MGKRLDLAIGVLNGTIGDHLARTRNGLATTMALYRDGRPLPLDRDGLARALPGATGRVALLVHGVMNTEGVWAFPDGSDYGSLLARDLGLTPLYVRYNSGLRVAESGAALARLLDAVVAAYPGPLAEVLPIGYSMGGLVVRSACEAARLAGSPWLRLVRRAIYLGTPHLGSPLERAGRLLARLLHAVDDPYTRLAGRLGDLRSGGIKDLGDAHPAPLAPGVAHFLVAGALAASPALATLLGDAVVPVSSATDAACTSRASVALPPGHVRIMPGVGHVALARHVDVYAHIRAWCGEAG